MEVPLSNVVVSYSEDRKFRMKVGNEISIFRRPEAGVPHGAFLSLIYSIYAADISKSDFSRNITIRTLC